MRSQIRAGFTLIELMVAMALTMFIMVILSQAFILSLETFSAMKGIGDMQQNLRVAEVMLRNDLVQDHFEGKRRLSDQTLAGTPLIVAQPPQVGFFVVVRGSATPTTTLPTPSSTPPYPPYVWEGNDANGMPSYRASDHMIYMTVKRRGNRQENFFTTALNGGPGVLNPFFNQRTVYNMDPRTELPYATWTDPYTNFPTGYYSSQWAEVIYYLKRTGSTEEPTNVLSTLGTRTYSLYRAQFVMVPDSTRVNTAYTSPTFNIATIAPNFYGLSCRLFPNPAAPTKLEFHSPADAAMGNRLIFDAAAFNPNDPRVIASSTLVLPNVISFHVQTMPTSAAAGAPSFGDVPNTTGQTYGVYDTTKFTDPSYSNNLRVGLKGIQATMRVWDNKTRQTRQTTVIQDL